MRKKKVLSLVLVAAMATTMLAACGDKKTETATPDNTASTSTTTTETEAPANNRLMFATYFFTLYIINKTAGKATAGSVIMFNLFFTVNMIAYFLRCYERKMLFSSM